MAAGVSVLSDLPYSGAAACRPHASSAEMERANARVPTAKYTKMGETLRHVIPGHMQCSMACGGRACKYENPSRWSDQEQAIKGLYSSWITDNLLAMARPSTEIMEKYNIIEQFKRCGLKTVINLQRPGEHASCGNPLEQDGGFTYRPETFMEADVYYYNFGWKDYGVASLTTILDMVKVMSFAVQEGKMAVHCHAGLGRTGVLLACYLVFTSRMSADQAILFVRAKRPNSIQTRGQLLCVREFAQFLVPLRSVFSCAEPRAGAVTLSQYLTRQRHLLHGYEARRMKNVPKVVQLVCRLLLDIAANRPAEDARGFPGVPDLTAEVEKTVSQRALQQLGKEMRGKGIPAPPSSSPGSGRGGVLPGDSEPEPQRSSLSRSRRLSYSDSVLHQPQQLRSRPISPFTFPIRYVLSHSSLGRWEEPSPPPPDVLLSLQDRDVWSPCSRKQLLRGIQSLSLDLDQLTDISSPSGRGGRGEEEEERRDRGDGPGPFVSLPAELAPESRRLLVAKVLSVDGTDKHLSSKVSWWQTELNSREGAWERLRAERDPLVLCGLMWSWLEQLKDPVLSSQDARALGGTEADPRGALDSLEKDRRLTLLCVLDCAARLLPMPEDVETGFLHRTIKAFTKLDSASEMNESPYATLKANLTRVLHGLGDHAEDAMEEN